jgi:DNA-binding MarR family transcriptional regulator
MSDTGPLPRGEDIDRLVHEPVRYRILACLFVVESADFLFLSRQLGLTQGNLSSHLSRLEAAGYVSVDKTFDNRRPRTVLRLTLLGRDAFTSYVTRMRQLLAEVDAPAEAKPRPRASARRALKPRTT